MEELDLLTVMHTLQAEGWKFDLYQVVPPGVWRGWWFKPGDSRFPRSGDPTGFNMALRKAWRLRAYYGGGDDDGTATAF